MHNDNDDTYWLCEHHILLFYNLELCVSFYSDGLHTQNIPTQRLTLPQSLRITALLDSFY